MRLPPKYTGRYGSGSKEGYVLGDYDDYLLARLYRLDVLWEASCKCRKGCTMRDSIYNNNKYGYDYRSYERGKHLWSLNHKEK